MILSFELPKKSSWVVAPQTNLSPTQFYNLIALGYGNMIAVFISDIAVQSHYIEVAQGADSSRAIHNWLWIFSLFWGKIFFSKNQFYKRDVLQLFSADATMI